MFKLVISKSGDLLSRRPRPSLGGTGLLQDPESTFALFGMSAATGLGLVAFVSQQGCPVLGWADSRRPRRAGNGARRDLPDRRLPVQRFPALVSGRRGSGAAPGSPTWHGGPRAASSRTARGTDAAPAAPGPADVAGPRRERCAGGPAISPRSRRRPAARGAPASGLAAPPRRRTAGRRFPGRPAPPPDRLDRPEPGDDGWQR